jgi:small subunit ribosomal protein S21
MIIIDVKKAGGIERALKDLKRKWRKMGTQAELRERTAYIKPCIKRRAEIARAAYRESLQSESNKD